MENSINNLLSNKLLEADTCDLTGLRQPNVKVNIGYGKRNYFGYTNQFAQLVYVEAKNLIIQNEDDTLLIKGRYCKNEAFIPGCESPYLDQGHIIADKLGGVSNAYNITPQAKYLNTVGEYSKAEDQIYKALISGISVTDFKCKIIYKNNQSMVPIRYELSYTIGDNQYNHVMDNNKKRT